MPAVRLASVLVVVGLVGCTPDAQVSTGGGGGGATVGSTSVGSSASTSPTSSGANSGSNGATSGASTADASSASAGSTSVSTGSVVPVTLLPPCGGVMENFDAGLGGWSISGTSSYQMGHVELEASDAAAPTLSLVGEVPTQDCYLTVRVAPVALPAGTHVARLRAYGSAVAYASYDGAAGEKHGIEGGSSVGATSGAPPITGLGLAFVQGTIRFFYKDAGGWVQMASQPVTIGMSTIRMDVDGAVGTRFAFDDFNVEPLEVISP